MDFPTSVKLAIYRLFADHGSPPPLAAVAELLGASLEDVRTAYETLGRNRLLVLEADRATIRMAPPFSGVPTRHRVTVGEVSYFANCAWDAFGIPAALHKPGLIQSECAESLTPFHLEIGLEGPPRSPWLFHCLVPAARWWADITFT